MTMTYDIRAKVEECFVLADKHFGKKLPRARVRFDLTGTTAGQSFYSKGWLRFNTRLAVANGEDFINRTVPHEVAHYIQRHIYGYQGVKPHGREWKKIMIEVFRLPPTRCHSYDVTTVKRNTKPYKYTCACAKIHEMGNIKHQKIIRGAVFTCNHCRSDLEFVGKQNAPMPQSNKFLREEIL